MLKQLTLGSNPLRLHPYVLFGDTQSVYDPSFNSLLVVAVQTQSLLSL